MRIADPDSRGEGEIQLRGPSVFAGYLDNPDANRAAFTEDGWFRTGDLGRVDDDGYVYVSGRLKEMIVLGGGKKIFPEELEKRYGASPFIREVAVLERRGALVALVVPDAAAIRSSANPSVEAVVRVALASVAQGLPSHERLSGFVVARQPLPRTRLGKYQRFLLPRLYDEALAGRGPRAAKPLSDEDRALLAGPKAAAAWRVLQARYAGARLVAGRRPAARSRHQFAGVAEPRSRAGERPRHPDRRAGFRRGGGGARSAAARRDEAGGAGFGGSRQGGDAGAGRGDMAGADLRRRARRLRAAVRPEPRARPALLSPAGRRRPSICRRLRPT